MRFCSKCGAEVVEDALYCENCGEKLIFPAEVIASNSYKKYDNIKERNIVLAIIFTILTCGIYSIYWMIKINDESLMLASEKGPAGGIVFLFTIITCGIYGYFWSYKMGLCVDKMKNNQTSITGILYVVLNFLGIGIVNYIISQDAINNKVGKYEG